MFVVASLVDAKNNWPTESVNQSRRQYFLRKNEQLLRLEFEVIFSLRIQTPELVSFDSNVFSILQPKLIRGTRMTTTTNQNCQHFLSSAVFTCSRFSMFCRRRDQGFWGVFPLRVFNKTNLIFPFIPFFFTIIFLLRKRIIHLNDSIWPQWPSNDQIEKKIFFFLGKPPPLSFDANQTAGVRLLICGPLRNVFFDFFEKITKRLLRKKENKSKTLFL